MNEERRDARRAVRTGDLLDRAMAIVVAEGIDALTIARLANDAGSAVGALYRYFPSKDALVVGLQERAIRDLGDIVAAETAAIAALELSPPVAAVARALVVFGAWSVFAARSPSAWALADVSLSDPRALLDDEDARRVNAAILQILSVAMAALDDAVALGALAPGDNKVRTCALWAAAHGVEHFRKRDRLMPPELACDRIREQLWRSLIGGWGASADVAARAVAAVESQIA